MESKSCESEVLYYGGLDGQSILNNTTITRESDKNRFNWEIEADPNTDILYVMLKLGYKWGDITTHISNIGKAVSRLITPVLESFKRVYESRNVNPQEYRKIKYLSEYGSTARIRNKNKKRLNNLSKYK